MSSPTARFTTKPPVSRFVQAMAGLHYGEWGGVPFRTLYGVSGLFAALLFPTGFLLWWLPQRRAARAKVVQTHAEEPAPLHVKA